MTSKEMHYDFKQKLNKLDSQKYSNLKVPEIDWKLNEAQEVIIKMIAQPRYNRLAGFEINQRSIDDISKIVVNQSDSDMSCLMPEAIDDSSFKVSLPEDYFYYLPSTIYASKGACKKQKMRRVTVAKHNFATDSSPFNRSSFEWRVVNISFYSDGIKIHTDGTFVPDMFCMNYIRKPRLIHNAASFPGGSYKALNGDTLSGTQDCELNESLHREIVDLAVLITSGDLSLPDFAIKQSKIRLVNS